MNNQQAVINLLQDSVSGTTKSTWL